MKTCQKAVGIFNKKFSVKIILDSLLTNVKLKKQCSVAAYLGYELETDYEDRKKLLCHLWLKISEGNVLK